MKEALYFIIDLADHILRRCMIIYLFHGLLVVKGRYIKRERLVEAGFIVFTTFFYMMVNYLPFFKKLFYGSEEGMLESRASILPMFVSLLLMLLYCLYFYSGKKSRICYLVFAACTLNELVLFTLHSLFTLLLKGISAVLVHMAMGGNEFVLQNFPGIFEIVQILWNLTFQIVFLLLLYYAFRILKQNLIYNGRELNNVQELFLAVPCAMGLCFCILLRSIMYAFNGSQINFLMDEYPETNVLIPAVSALCLSLILLSASILKKMVECSEKEVLVEIYQNQISDMEEHMKDVEHLYDGIRGMRHDMKNYVADLEILFKKEHKPDGEYEIEMQRYLDGMCNAMEELDMKCNTGNPVTDVVISRKMREAQQDKIPFECNFIFPEKLKISAFDLSILLNNGLDNALEASESEENPFIKLDSYVRERMFFIEIRNAFTGSLKEEETEKSLKTSKKDSALHGLGMKNMKNCAEKYFGALKWKNEDGEFLLTIMLQGKE